MDSELKRAIIIENYSKPKHHGLVNDDTYISRHSSSSTCIDDFKFQLKTKDNKVIDARFDGIGCAISTSAISILTSLIIDQDLASALKILNEYKMMLNNNDYDENLLQEACAFDTLHLQPNRLHCGSIGADALITMIKEAKEKNGKQ